MSELYSRTDKKTSLFGLQVHGPVFFTSASLILLSIVLTLLYRDSASGLSFVLGIDNGLVTQVSLIAGITLVATVSVVSGIQKGVKFLSEMNMRIAVGG